MLLIYRRLAERERLVERLDLAERERDLDLLDLRFLRQFLAARAMLEPRLTEACMQGRTRLAVLVAWISPWCSRACTARTYAFQLMRLFETPPKSAIV